MHSLKNLTGARTTKLTHAYPQGESGDVTNDLNALLILISVVGGDECLKRVYEHVGIRLIQSDNMLIKTSNVCLWMVRWFSSTMFRFRPLINCEGSMSKIALQD